MDNNVLEKIKVYRGNPLVMGATVIGEAVNFAITAKVGSNCEVVLYEKGKKEEAFRIPFENAQVIGNVYAMSVMGIDYKSYEYNFAINGEILTDRYAKALSGKKQWGSIGENLRGIIINDDYEWQQDAPLNIPFDETILYRMHVRGFTKHSSSKVRHKGTYLGIVDKIPYLKELGVTMIELMPAYEFIEIKKESATSMRGQFDIEAPVLNYWGYTDGYMFAPKAAYAYSENPGSEVEEFKYMVRELHKNGIEISMEFFFPHGANPKRILDCLHYWVMEYHIDGIHVNCEEAVMRMIETDNLLCTTKIFTYSFSHNTDFYSTKNETRNLANFNDDFMICARKFLKGDEDMLNTMSYKIKANPPGAAVVNYIANHNTFTLYDMVTYERKYNEANGENNKDGAVYNYSWNCGTEGNTRKRKIMDLRKRQIKNALCLVLLSQGVPMIYAGDEMCNSQRGNNNPYCLDNEISWTNWNSNAMAKEIFAFTKMLIDFRKGHKILHLSEETRQMDYKSYGLPDMSYHGTKAWYADFSHFNRHFSAMYCGKYALIEGKQEEADVYVAYNMYWEPQQFGVPSARNKKKWKLVFSTDNGLENTEEIGRMHCVPGRCIHVLAAGNN
ncbi:alpha-amylase family glycosyl hydrolase [uncultured Eubacterium sp.]|uniref:alpha-amylase family glycosyl hydrolase n=1 Tax=uncultured Eubacterium sp. TaxID=165185 RepID=UPI002671B023|nr:alpha-amylase family glycosyl hydrolase [uncultured Eubacterium sp.]